MVEVFKTSISNAHDAIQMLEILHGFFPTYHFNFDLHDCDNILRVEASEVNHEGVTEILHQNDSFCERLN